jgi:hypothetical protein
VLEPVVLATNEGFKADVRRVVANISFARLYDPEKLAAPVTPQHALAALVPRGQKQRMVYPREFELIDRNGDRRECIGEAFNTKHQILILLRDNQPLSATRIALPGTATFQRILGRLPRRA